MRVLKGLFLAALALCALTQSAMATMVTVSFQQGTGGYAGAKDTYVHEDAATTNQGTNPKIISDGDDDLGLGESQAQEVQGLIRFDNMFISGGGASRIGGSLPDGATIVSAFLKLRTGTATGDESPSPQIFNLHRMIATWDETATWNSMTTSGVGIARDNIEAATAVTASATGGNVAVLGGLVVFDVTADVQIWSSNNSLSTRGWLIHPDGVNLGGGTVSGQTNGWYVDSSNSATVANRPILEVTYEMVPEPNAAVLGLIGVGIVGMFGRKLRGKAA